MKIIHFMIVVLLTQTACTVGVGQNTLAQVKAERKAISKSPFVIKQPKEYPRRELDNGKSYDPKPRVAVIDEKAGKYELRWIGYDRKEKIAIYRRRDAIDAVVAAKVEKTDSGKYLYTYAFRMLPTSPTYFRTFRVQTFAQDTQPVGQNNDLFGSGIQGNNLGDFQSGLWRVFGFVGDETARTYGGNILEFKMVSSSQPGIVKCHAEGGDLTFYAPEELPPALEDVLPGFIGDVAVGYTIGPVETLVGRAITEKSKYLLVNLPKFIEAGWMSEGTAKIYEMLLRKEDLAGAYEQAKRDLPNEYITSEVFHIIEGLAQ